MKENYNCWEKVVLILTSWLFVLSLVCAASHNYGDGMAGWGGRKGSLSTTQDGYEDWQRNYPQRPPMGSELRRASSVQIPSDQRISQSYTPGPESGLRNYSNDRMAPMVFSSSHPISVNEALNLCPNSTIILTLKLISFILTGKDQEDIDALLIQLLEYTSDRGIPPNMTVISLLIAYMSQKGCHLEAFAFFMTVIENNIMDRKLWDLFIDKVKGLKESKEIDEQIKENVMQSIREWMDINIPQLEIKPNMDEMEKLNERLFPPLTDYKPVINE